MSRSPDKYGPIELSSSEDVYRAFGSLGDSDVEELYSVFLDSDKRVIDVELISRGFMSAEKIHPLEVYRSALLSSSASVIFVHCHPSGDCRPSGEDGLITEQLYEAGALMGIDVRDHVIIGEQEYYSYADESNLMQMLGEKYKKQKNEDKR